MDGKHCWHKTQLTGDGFVRNYDGEVCCFCGAKWSEHLKVPRLGHGKFDPDPVAPPKESDGCVARLMEMANRKYRS